MLLVWPWFCTWNVTSGCLSNHDGLMFFLMPPASIRFIREGAYNRKAAMAMAIPGVVAVLITAFIVKSLPLDILRWLVIVVILYTSTVMLRAAYSKSI